MAKSKDKEEKGKKRREVMTNGRREEKRASGMWICGLGSWEGAGEVGRGWAAPQELLVTEWACWGSGLPVSPHTGRYSSCWMSSMISRPLPVPPFMVMSRGFPSCPALKV